jgi:hypothetical protein
MKNPLQKLRCHIYRFVHSNGMAADAVYWSAFHVQNLLKRLQYWQLSKRPVTPEELLGHRHLEPSSALMANVTNICNAKCSFCAYPKVAIRCLQKTG